MRGEVGGVGEVEGKAEYPSNPPIGDEGVVDGHNGEINTRDAINDHDRRLIAMIDHDSMREFIL